MTTEESKGTLVDDLLNRTKIAVRECDLHGLRAVITDAWNAKVQHSLANLPEFRQHLSLLTTHVAGKDDEHLVLALAEMGRLHTIRSTREWVEGLAAQLLLSSFPASFHYGDGRQRYFTAVAVVSSGIPVELDVLARSVVEEEKGANARREWIGAMLERAPLSEVFEHLAQAIIVTDGMSGQSRSIRLQHILSTLNTQFVQVDIQIDDGFCDGVPQLHSQGIFQCPSSAGVQNVSPSSGGACQVCHPANTFEIQAWCGPGLLRGVGTCRTVGFERWLDTAYKHERYTETATTYPSRRSGAVA